MESLEVLIGRSVPIASLIVGASSIADISIFLNGSVDYFDLDQGAIIEGSMCLYDLITPIFWLWYWFE